LTNRFVDLAPVDVAGSREVLGLDADFATVGKPPIPFHSPVAASALHPPELPRAFRRPAASELAHQLFKASSPIPLVGAHPMEIDLYCHVA
jgi:hypothetical protein